MRSPEAIDDGQNKQALQHANKLLKKNPDWPLIKVDMTSVYMKDDSYRKGTHIGFEGSCICANWQGR